MPELGNGYRIARPHGLVIPERPDLPHVVYLDLEADIVAAALAVLIHYQFVNPIFHGDTLRVEDILDRVLAQAVSTIGIYVQCAARW